MWTPFIRARRAFVAKRLTTHSGPLQASCTASGAADNCELETGKAWQADSCAWCDQLCCCSNAAQLYSTGRPTVSSGVSLRDLKAPQDA